MSTAKNTMIVVLGMLTLGVGCGRQPDSAGAPGARGSGKADWTDRTIDASLSCQGACGSIVYGTPMTYCGCDDECSLWGDCCHDKAQLCDGPDKAACEAIDVDYRAALSTAGGCSADADCSKFLGGSLDCGHPLRVLNPTLAGPVETLVQRWNDSQCGQVDWGCPMFSAGSPSAAPMPPWMETRGVCEQGSCKVEIVDTRTTRTECESLDSDYRAAVVAAGACTTHSDCDRSVGGSLDCGHPTRAINTALAGTVDSLRQQWTDQQCASIDWGCPMFSASAAPMPPWIRAERSCEAGSCTINYIDIRAASGEACGADIPCGDGLSCVAGNCQ